MHKNFLFYHLVIQSPSTFAILKQNIFEILKTTQTHVITTSLESTANKQIGWFAFLNPTSSYAPAIITDIKQRLNTSIPFELKSTRLLLKNAHTWALGVRCAHSDAQELEVLLSTQLISTKDTSTYSSYALYAPFRPTPSISASLLSRIIASHKQFIVNTMAFRLPSSTKSEDKLLLRQHLKKCIGKTGLP